MLVYIWIFEIALFTQVGTVNKKNASITRVWNLNVQGGCAFVIYSTKGFVMARLFTIDIPFENNIHTALVTIRESGYDICCQVRYVDKSLRHIIPGDQVIFSLQEGLMEPKNLPNELAQNLVKCTSHVLAAFLQVSKNL